MKTVVMGFCCLVGAGFISSSGLFAQVRDPRLQDCDTASRLGFELNGEDESPLLLSILARYAGHGGGCLIIDTGRCLRVDSQIVIPTDANSYTPPIRILGGGTAWGSAQNIPRGTTFGCLDLRFAGTGGTFDARTYGIRSAKINALSSGYLELGWLDLQDKGQDCTTFVMVTGTMTYLHDIRIAGTSHTTPCNIATIWGGTNAYTIPLAGTPNDWFTGYSGGAGMYNFQCRDTATCIFLGSSANGLSFRNGIIGQGGMTAGNRAQVEINGTTPPNANSFANIIHQMDSGGDIDHSFVNGYYVAAGAHHNFFGPALSFYDGLGGQLQHAFNFASGAGTSNIVFPFFNDGHQGTFTGPALSEQVLPARLLSGTGARLASASTITPTNQLHHVSGTMMINVIATPNINNAMAEQVTLIADDSWTVTNAGNIASPAFAAVAGMPYTFVWSPAESKWYGK
jgi:hypothetical protein